MFPRKMTVKIRGEGKIIVDYKKIWEVLDKKDEEMIHEKRCRFLHPTNEIEWNFIIPASMARMTSKEIANDFFVKVIVEIINSLTEG